MSPTSLVRDHIESGNREFMEAFKRQDASGVAARYTAEAQVLPPNSDMLRGTGAIQEFWAGAMKMGLTALQLRTAEVEEHGEMAVEVGRYTIYAGEAVADEGKYVVVWKSEGGAWKLHRDIWNSSTPAAS